MHATAGCSLLAVALALTACGSQSDSTAPETGAVIPVLVTGTVHDSLSGGPVREALVTTTIDNALTDANGRYELLAKPGSVRLSVIHPHYARRSFNRAAAEGASHALRIIPLTPTVLGCDVRDGTMWMLVVDLQGRKTIVRRDSSGVTLGSEPDRRWVVAHEFTWWALDALTWLVEGPEAGPDEAATAEWHLYDTDGNVRPHRCGSRAVPVLGSAGGGDTGTDTATGHTPE